MKKLFWYTLQITIAFYIAYYWTTLPGHSPENFGHGLALGGIVAWYGTLLLTGILDAIRSMARKANASIVKLIDRRRKKHPSNQITVSRAVRPRPPNLIP